MMLKIIVSITILVAAYATPATAQKKAARGLAEYYFKRGASFYVGDNVARKQAIVNYTKSVAFDSSYYWSYRNRGYCYQNLGKYALALADYNRAIRLSKRAGDSEEGNLYPRCALVCTRLKKWAAAETYYSAFLNTPGYDSANYRSAWRGRAEARSQLKKYADARQDYLVYYRQLGSELLPQEKELADDRARVAREGIPPGLSEEERASLLAGYLKREATISQLKKEQVAIADEIAKLEKLLR
ncbi:MAG: tetratricopeptide repeat protein [Janthinobacterium lividum]